MTGRNEFFELIDNQHLTHHSSASWNPVTPEISITSLDSNFRWNDEELQNSGYFKELRSACRTDNSLVAVSLKYFFEDYNS